ncbi:hydroxypyruvate isomerase family protein [Atopomonas sediminilitoris]|uniref:hydroxypyruvate isomerase family protein n=1 Tax=Atopomonas sediminilitoris TaxID=2919919 RepID=UPI001F4E1A85|nr:TIM barrel protein [Atopomonas sediminilitoris]
MKLCANLSLLFTELPLLERVAAAKQAGFDGVEIQFPYDVPAAELRAALQAAQLPLVLINVPAGDLLAGGAGLACVPDQQVAFAAALAEALAYAQVVKPERVNVLPGRFVANVSEADALACLAANLHTTATAFAVLDIAVVTEAINPLDLPGFAVSTPDDLQALLQHTAHPNVKAQLDLYHMARQKLDVAACIKQLGAQIGHVQFADYPGRGQPGTGKLDFAAAKAALNAVGYTGWLSAEYRPQGATLDSLGWLAAWRADA